MKRCILALLALVMIQGTAFAAAKADKAVTVGGNRSYYNIYDEDTMSSDSATGLPTQQSVKAYIDSTAVRFVQLPLLSFGLDDLGAISVASVPGIESDDGVINIVWADGEVSPAEITFRIPNDYQSGGLFKVLATESDSTTPNQIDFDVYVNTPGVSIDTVRSNQTPVALDQATSTPSEVTLQVSTDFASLAAGDWVHLRLWRDNTAAGTGDLEVKGVGFYYTAAQ